MGKMKEDGGHTLHEESSAALAAQKRRIPAEQTVVLSFAEDVKSIVRPTQGGSVRDPPQK
jgi:hypothetical protein